MPSVAGLLLTGGRSRRMGRPKARLMFDGEDLAARGARLLRGVGDPVLEVGPGYSSLPTVSEDEPGEGPLAALAAAGRAGVLPAGMAVLVLAVDMPLVTPALVELVAGYPAPATTSVVPVDRSGRDQPLCARWSASAIATSIDLVERGRRSLRDLLAATVVVRIGPAEWEPLAGPDALSDVDTPADLARIR